MVRVGEEASEDGGDGGAVAVERESVGGVRRGGERFGRVTRDVFGGGWR